MICLFYPSSWSPETWEYFTEGCELSCWTCLLTVLLEIWSLDTVTKILRQRNAGLSLYLHAIFANLRNHFFIGVPIYVFAVKNYSRPIESMGLGDQMTCVATILFVHSLVFYAVHRAFHSYPQLYHHHRFHHRFNRFVPPIAANAVSPVEYIFAYIIPFVVGMSVVEPDTLSLRLSVSIVSFTNLLIHTPKLSEMSTRLVPEWLVTTEDHLEHHRLLNTKYAAPTFNIDYFLSFVEGQQKISK